MSRLFADHLHWAVTLMALALSAVGFAASGQSQNAAQADLVRQAVHNEIASGNSSQRFRFKDEKKTVHLWQTKLIIETPEATAGMLIMQDGKPLSPQQHQAEVARLENYVHNPDELSKKRKQEKEDADRTEKILRAMPDAFLYHADGTQPGTDSVGRRGDQLVRLKFWPNPNYSPPSHVEQVLTGMAGHVLVDANEKRIAEIDGTLEKEVGFGWGILGHLDPGGRFVVQQADVGNHQWELTRMELSFTGKILLFKKLDIRSSDIFSDFRPVPSNLTFAEAVNMLEKEVQQSGARSGAESAEGQLGQSERRARPKAELVVDTKREPPRLESFRYEP